MNIARLREILDKTTCQLRKGEQLEGTPELVEQAKRGEQLKGGGTLEIYDMPHESDVRDPQVIKVDLVFVIIGVNKANADAHRSELIALLHEYPDPETLAAGPSYISVGATIGDQGAAFQLFALGKVLGLWEVITPETLGVSDPVVARQMAGAGYLMCSGYRRS